MRSFLPLAALFLLSSGPSSAAPVAASASPSPSPAAPVGAIQSPADRQEYLQELGLHVGGLEAAMLQTSPASLASLSVQSPAAALSAAGLQAQAVDVYLAERLTAEPATPAQWAARQTLVEALARPSFRGEAAAAIDAVRPELGFSRLLSRAAEIEEIRPYPLLPSLVGLRAKLFDGAGKAKAEGTVRGHLSALFDNGAAPSGEAPVRADWAPFQRRGTPRPRTLQRTPGGALIIPVRIASSEDLTSEAAYVRRVAEAAATVLAKHVDPLEPESLFYPLLRQGVRAPLDAKSLEAIAQVDPHGTEPWNREAVSEALRRLKGRFPAVDSQAKFSALLAEMLRTLKDKFSRFLPGETVKASWEREVGVGAELDWAADPGRAVLFSVWPGMPAEKAGLRAGDELIRIDGRALRSRSEAAAALSADEEEELRLAVRRRGPSGEPIEFEVPVRRVPLRPGWTAFSRMLPRKTGYIYIDDFSPKTGEEAVRLARALVAQGAKSLVIDLRYNGGGDEPVVIALAKEFLAAGQTALLAQGRDRILRRETASRDGEFARLPAAVLVGRHTGSAAEVLAAAFAARGNAFVLGAEPTYGKDKITKDFPLPDGSIIRLSVERWFTPEGGSVEGRGLAPRYRIDVSPEEELAVRSGVVAELRGGLPTAARDPVLDAALAVLASR